MACLCNRHHLCLIFKKAQFYHPADFKVVLFGLLVESMSSGYMLPKICSLGF